MRMQWVRSSFANAVVMSFCPLLHVRLLLCANKYYIIICLLLSAQRILLKGVCVK